MFYFRSMHINLDQDYIIHKTNYAFAQSFQQFLAICKPYLAARRIYITSVTFNLSQLFDILTSIIDLNYYQRKLVTHRPQHSNINRAFNSV